MQRTAARRIIAERTQPMQTAQQRQSTPITSFLFGVLIIVMIIAFSALAAAQFGYSFGGATQQPAPQPTAIIRVVAPAAPVVQPAPIQAAPAPAVAPEPAQPAVAAPEQPVVEAQPAPVQRQIIVIKNGADPGSAPVVIDRGTKRRSP